MRIASGLWKALPVLLVFGLIWAAAIVHWQSSSYDPSGAELLIYLLVLPLAALLAYHLLRRSFDAIKTRQSAAANAAPQAEPNPDQPSSPQQRTLLLLESSVAFAQGNSAAALDAALADRRRPGLHRALRDHRGLPVFAAAAEDVDETRPPTPWAVLAAAESKSLDRRQRRALILASRVLEALMANAQSVLAQPPPAPVALHFALPTDWSPTARTAAVQWLRKHLASLPAAEARVVAVTETTIATPVELLRFIDGLHAHLETSAAPGPQLLLACESLIDERQVGHMSRSGMLLGSGNEEGQIPGEGAAGLVLSMPPSEPAVAAQPSTSSTRLLLHAVRHSQFAQTGDGTAARRQREKVLPSLFAELLQAAPLGAEDVGFVVSDADLRPSRIGEIVSFMNTSLPGLDGMDDCSHVESAMGCCGPVSTLAGLALSAHRAALRHAPGLFVSLRDDNARLMLAVAPISEPSAATAPAEAATA